MKIDNPFESGQIKNYILLYVIIIVIMVLFFIATTLFNNIKEVEKKVFDVNATEFPHAKSAKQEINNSKFRLMKKIY